MNRNHRDPPAPHRLAETFGRLRQASAALAATLAATASLPLIAGGMHAAAALDSTCSAGGVRAAFRSFTVAFNNGAYQRLDASFAPAPLFHWYSSNPPGLRRTATAEDRTTLIGYFRSRHAHNDRLRLAQFKFTGNTAAGSNFWFTMRRSADDYRHGAWFTLQGKGVALCTGDDAQFVTLSLGGPGSAPS